MLYKSTNFYFLQYINFYDLLNKYFYKSFYIVPSISFFTFAIFVKGRLNFRLFRKCLINFLLLYFFCFSFPQITLKLSRLKNRKTKIYKAKFFLTYVVTKKKVLLSAFHLYFILNRFVRPFFFSCQNFIFSKFGGKLLFYKFQIITFLPSFFLIDLTEQYYFKSFKGSKIFLTITIKNHLSTENYNFFFPVRKSALPDFRNGLLLWCFI